MIDCSWELVHLPKLIQLDLTLSYSVDLARSCQVYGVVPSVDTPAKSPSGVFVPYCGSSLWQASQPFSLAIFCAPATALVETAGAFTHQKTCRESRECHCRCTPPELIYRACAILVFMGKWKASLQVLRFPLIYLKFLSAFLLSHPLPLAEA